MQICVAVCWDEVVFPSGDCAFGCIVSVNVGWYELVGHSVVVHSLSGALLSRIWSTGLRPFLLANSVCIFASAPGNSISLQDFNSLASMALES